MPTSTHKPISSLIAEVDSGEILLPEIQRGYVWKPGQIAYLLDSLYRGYPSGSMLLWKPSEEVQVRGLAIEASGKAPAHSPLYLLDGQQRLTSLHRVVHGHAEAQVVFFVGEPQRFQVQSAATKKDPRWVPVADVFGNASLMQLTTAVTDGGSDLNADDVYERLNRLRQVRDRPFYVEIVEGLTYGEVAEIFVRVNSRGRSLKTVDLTLALLSTEWPGVVEKVDEAEAFWKSQGWPGIDATFLVRALAATATDGGLLTQLPRTAHGATPAIEEAWLDVRFGIEFVVQILRENLGVTSSSLITSMNALVPLVALLGKYRQPGQAAFDQADALAYWLFAVLVTGRFSAAADSKIAQDAMAVRQADPIRALYANAGLLGTPLRIVPEQLIGKGSSSAYFLLSFLTARKRQAKDWWHDVVVGQQGAGNFALEYHHIHPRATLAGTYTKGEINDLANLAFISAKANKKISDRSPSDYFPELDGSGAGADQLSPHLVPTEPDLRTSERYQHFIARRRELLASAMTELLDERRPSWVEDASVPPAGSKVPAHERSLALTLYASPWDSLVFDATAGDERYVTSIPIVDVERFVGDAADGLASSLAIGDEVVEHAPDADELQLPIGPFLVTGDPSDWTAVLARERADTTMPDTGESPIGAAWSGDREVFPVLDSD
jgi:hypothetical protein